MKSLRYEAITLVNGLLLIYSNDVNSISSSVRIYITLNPTICFITPTKTLSVYSKPSYRCLYYREFHFNERSKEKRGRRRSNGAKICKLPIKKILYQISRVSYR